MQIQSSKSQDWEEIIIIHTSFHCCLIRFLFLLFLGSDEKIGVSIENFGLPNEMAMEVSDERECLIVQQ